MHTSPDATSTSTRASSTTPTRGRSTPPGTGSTPASARPTTTTSCRRSCADRPEDSGLIYLSLGSLGSADVGLMQRLIDVLGTTRHRVIVSMGPRADELRLADNMTGAATLPQTTLMPQVDLVITHGGNNTTTEAMHFGKPMVAAAALLGPVRQRPARARARLRRPARDVRLRRRRADRRRRPAARRHASCESGWRAIGADIRARDGPAPGRRDHRAGRPGRTVPAADLLARRATSTRSASSRPTTACAPSR